MTANPTPVATWVVQPRLVCAGDAANGIANQWWVSLGGYLWCVSENTKGKRSCTCRRPACDHITATEKR